MVMVALPVVIGCGAGQTGVRRWRIRPWPSRCPAVAEPWPGAGSRSVWRLPPVAQRVPGPAAVDDGDDGRREVAHHVDVGRGPRPRLRAGAGFQRYLRDGEPLDRGVELPD